MAKIDDVINSLSPEEINILNNDPQMLAAFKAKYMGPESTPNMHSEMLSGQDVKDLWNAAGAIPKGAAAVMTGLGQSLGTGAAAVYNGLKGNPVDIAEPMAETGKQMVKIAAGEERAPGGASTFTDLLDPRYVVLGEILGPLLGKALSLFARKGAGAIGEVVAWLAPNQSSDLLAFLRQNPDFFKWVKGMNEAIIQKAEEATASGKGVAQPLSSALKATKPMVEEALQTFKMSPQAFVEDLKGTIDVLEQTLKNESKIPLTNKQFGTLYAANKLLTEGIGKNTLQGILKTALGVGGMATLLRILGSFFGPLGATIGTLAGGAGEYALSHPGFVTGLEKGLGNLVSKVGTAAPVVAKVGTAAPSLINAGLQANQ